MHINLSLPAQAQEFNLNKFYQLFQQDLTGEL